MSAIVSFEREKVIVGGDVRERNSGSFGVVGKEGKVIISARGDHYMRCSPTTVRGRIT